MSFFVTMLVIALFPTPMGGDNRVKSRPRPSCLCRPADSIAGDKAAEATNRLASLPDLFFCQIGHSECDSYESHSPSNYAENHRSSPQSKHLTKLSVRAASFGQRTGPTRPALRT